MENKRKYQVGRSACGWGIWEVATDKKIQGFGRDRIAALEMWYDLEGWKKPTYWY